MKTESLIRLLAADTARTLPVARQLRLLLPLALLVAGVALWALPGLRADLLGELARSPRVGFKILASAACAVAATGALLRLARPQGEAGPWGRALVAAALAVAAAAALELVLLPAREWLPAARGTNALFCLQLIPAFAIAPLAVLLHAMRAGAPAHPTRAGALAGLAAGGFAATLYALHCTDDSPLFVLLWYGLAVAAVTAAGALAGRRLLRW